MRKSPLASTRSHAKREREYELFAAASLLFEVVDFRALALARITRAHSKD